MPEEGRVWIRIKMEENEGGDKSEVPSYNKIILVKIIIKSLIYDHHNQTQKNQSEQAARQKINRAGGFPRRQAKRFTC